MFLGCCQGLVIGIDRSGLYDGGFYGWKQGRLVSSMKEWEMNRMGLQRWCPAFTFTKDHRCTKIA